MFPRAHFLGRTSRGATSLLPTTMFAVSARTGASDRLVSRRDARREFSVSLSRAFPLARVHRVVVDDGSPVGAREGSRGRRANSVHRLSLARSRGDDARLARDDEIFSFSRVGARAASGTARETRGREGCASATTRRARASSDPNPYLTRTPRCVLAAQ